MTSCFMTGTAHEGDDAMTKTVAHIRHLFLDPKDTYPAAEAAEILGMELPGLTTLMESGELEGVRTCCGMKMSRKELISFAMDYWPQEAIEEPRRRPRQRHPQATPAG